MEGFKPTIKMKTGGSVSKAVEKCYGGAMKKKTGGKVDSADIKQDKAIVKKAFKIHDKDLHNGEKTDLSTLKKGGRAKKETGTVRKFKSGGSVTNVYEAKKSSGDKDNIRKTKDIKPAKAAAPSKAATKPAFKGSDVSKEKSKPAGTTKAVKVKENDKKAAAPSGAKGPDKFKKGGVIKKAAGGSIMDNILGTPEQNRIAQASMDKQAAGGSKLAKFFGGNPAPTNDLVDRSNTFIMGPNGQLIRNPKATPVPMDDLVDRSNTFIMGPNGQLIRNPKAKPIPAQLLNATSGYADGGSIDDDVRARAMKWIASGSPEQAAAPSAAVKKAVPKPDYSNEQVERMGLGEKGEIPVGNDEENKRESESLARRYPKKNTPAETARSLTGTSVPSMQKKGARLLSSVGLKRGGKAC